jgi:hypothetical protein
MKLDTLKCSIKQEETLGISKLTEQAIDDQIQRHNKFNQNEERIRQELGEASSAYELKMKQIKKEETIIQELNQQLQTLEAEKKMMEMEVSDLKAKETESQPRNRPAPKFAAIDKIEQKYQREMTQYNSQ